MRVAGLLVGGLTVISVLHPIDGIPAERTMKSLRVFFAHQSVGDNILDGVREIAPEVRIVRGELPRREPGFVDTLVGVNGSPASRNRSEFSDWLRRTYASAPIFDLAAIESRTPAGEAVTFRLDGRSYRKLNASYSDDGQHLGRQGRRIVAAAFLDMLDRLTQERRS